jgi:Kyakuja-Dileera-Zisupton transposase
MDYSLTEGVKNTNIASLKRLLAIYDIMCQYWKRLQLWMEESEYLELLLGVTILQAIGLFHVGGHVWECFSCLSLTFIPGAGQIDGEILESLWSVLHEILPSTQNATIAGRIEMLDDHMGDSTFKTMLDIGECMYT